MSLISDPEKQENTDPHFHSDPCPGICLIKASNVELKHPAIAKHPFRPFRPCGQC
jgi:hypothetical protein